MDVISCDSPSFADDLMPVDVALQHLERNVVPIKTTEIVSLSDGLNRVLAKPISSTIHVPQHANSSMDGYAIQLADWIGHDNVAYPVSQRIPAGTIGKPLEKNTAARIFTGAPIPAGADSVVMQELCQVSEQNGTAILKIQQLPELGQNIRSAGEDIKQGSLVLSQGRQLRAQELGLLASVGVSSVAVFRRLKVAVFFTGDEIIEPGSELKVGQIYNTNRYTLTALLQSWGCDVIDLGNVEDNFEATIEAFKAAADVADLIMTSGGVSVGEEDHIRPALESLGELEVWKIGIKPGKPLAFGKVRQIPFVGLPGNPVSVFATSCILARPFIKAMQGMSFEAVSGFVIKSGFDLPYIARRREYLRVQIQSDIHNQPELILFENQSSGVLTSASWADGFALVEVGTKLSKGDSVEFIPFGSFNS